MFNFMVLLAEISSVKRENRRREQTNETVKPEAEVAVGSQPQEEPRAAGGAL
jgi:hypothetical protein